MTGHRIWGWLSVAFYWNDWIKGQRSNTCTSEPQDNRILPCTWRVWRHSSSTNVQQLKSKFETSWSRLKKSETFLNASLLFQKVAQNLIWKFALKNSSLELCQGHCFLLMVAFSSHMTRLWYFLTYKTWRKFSRLQKKEKKKGKEKNEKRKKKPAKAWFLQMPWPLKLKVKARYTAQVTQALKWIQHPMQTMTCTKTLELT